MLPKKPVSNATSLPAPIGGWNARDSLADMEPTDAVIMENFWPMTTTVMLRKGYTQHATGLGAQVESIFSYSSPTANKLFGAAGTNIFNCTSVGAVGAAEVTDLANARFQYINVSTAGGNFMLCVNGADKLQGYDGSAWYVDGDTAHDITGFDTALAIHINLFKTRVWLVEKSSLRVWYLGANAISGAANSLDFSSIARRGGYLVAMGTWTIDAGYGVDDLAVFVTSNGEIIVYRGTDPSSANTWALVGVWQLGSPIGRRCFLKYAGDLLIITQDGLLPLASALQSSRLNPKVSLTDKIQQAMSSAATLYGSTYGWQIFYYAKANMLLMNVPVSVGAQQQFAMNTISKSWCNFKGVSSNVWELFNDEPYFGGNGFVGHFWNGLGDNNIDINVIGKQAFNYFNTRAQNKHFKMMRPVFLTDGLPSIGVILNVDFDDSSASSFVDYGTGTNLGSTWDTGLWDTAIWGGSQGIQQEWQGAQGIGRCAAPRIEISTQGINLQWMATDIIYERGGMV